MASIIHHQLAKAGEGWHVWSPQPHLQIGDRERKPSSGGSAEPGTDSPPKPLPSPPVPRVPPFPLRRNLALTPTCIPSVSAGKGEGCWGRQANSGLCSALCRASCFSVGVFSPGAGRVGAEQCQISPWQAATPLQKSLPFLDSWNLHFRGSYLLEGCSDPHPASPTLTVASRTYGTN